MFLYRRSLLSLTKPRTSVNALRCTTTRFNSSSSSSSCRDKENQVKLSQTDDTTTTVNSNNEKQQQQQQQQQLSFMPVINIPETELAHNAFFSLHRPLLGLSDKHERSFFSNRQEQEESPDDQLAKYMMTIQPFAPPPTPGAHQEEQQEQSRMNTHAEDDDDETLVSIEFTSGDMAMEGEEGEDQYFFDNTELQQQQQPSIPVFHMPESGDVVDYLTSIETKLKASNQKLELEELRLKKLEILNNLSGKTSSRRHVHNRLRRFQLKWRK